MTISGWDVADQRRLSDIFTKQVSVSDIRLSKVSAELLNAAPAAPFESSSEFVGTEYEQSAEIIVYYLAYEFKSADRDKQPFWNIRFTLSISFSVKTEVEISDAVLKAFGAHGVVDMAHPYARELVQDLTARMRVPAFILQVLPPRG